METSLSSARIYLHDAQDEAAFAVGVSRASRPSGTGSLVDTLAKIEEWRKLEPTDNPDVVRRGVFRYERALEERRISVAENLVRRSDPGPFEESGYLALLAYQAASVQMAIPLFLGEADVEDAKWTRYLIGTVPSAEVNAFARVSTIGGYTVILVNSGLIDFIYQAAKCVVEAHTPTRSADGLSAVTAHAAAADVQAEILRNSEPVNRLYRTLEAYLFEGYPRAFAHENVPPEYHPPLHILISMAERFVIAHEYGHSQTNLISTQNPHLMDKPWMKEFLADRHAMTTTVLSAHMLERWPPEFALGGSVFALTCLDLLRQALTLVRDGAITPDAGSESHPPCGLRIEQLFRSFHSHFDVEYINNHISTLAVVPDRSEPPPISEELERQTHGLALAYARTLGQVWSAAQQRLLIDFARHRPLHRMWQ